MDKLSKIGLAVTIILLIGWFYWQKEEAKKRAPEPVQSTELENVKEESIPVEESILVDDKDMVKEDERKEVKKVTENVEEGIEYDLLSNSQIINIETDLLSVELNKSGGVIQKLILKENPDAGIRKLPEEESGAVTLLSADRIDQALGAIIGVLPSELNFDREKNIIEFSGMLDEALFIKKKYIFKDGSYLANLHITISNESEENISWNGGPEFVCGSMKPIDKDDSLEVDILTTEGIKRKKETVEYCPESIEWIGLKTKYFTAIVKPETGEAKGYQISGVKKKKDEASKAIFGCARGAVSTPYEYLRATIKLSDLKLSPGGKIEYSFILYLGPANYELLKKEGEGFAEIVDLGFLSPICKAIIWLLGNIYRIIGSYGWAIIFLTIIVKLILWPLTHKSYKSMKEMQNLQPKIAELKEKYKKDAKKIQAETMKLYKEHGVNPMGGCLPLVFQMPVLIALFTTLRNTILLRKASFWIIPGQWIQDLSGPDKLATLPNSYPIIGNQLNILPLLMGLTFFLQQKFTPTSGAASPQSAQQQKMMATMMPIFFTFIFYSMPAGLNLYFMLSTIITVIQQYSAKGKK